MLAALAIAGCRDLDRAIEDKANEVLGKEPAQQAPEPARVPAPVPTRAPEPEPLAEPQPPPPPPQEVAKPDKPATETPVVEQPTVPEPKPAEPRAPLEAAKPLERKPKPMVPAPAPKPIEPAPRPVEPAPESVEVVKPEPAPKPVTRVTVPPTKHLKVSLPARVQELLNADPRMQPWLNSTLATIGECYERVLASDPSASGTIKFVLEMHENSRPDADIVSLPPQLSGVVACGTGKLMRGRRMPLFTGTEGEKHTISVKFSP